MLCSLGALSHHLRIRAQEANERRRKQDIQMDILRGQLARRTRQLGEQRKQYYDQLLTLHQQVWCDRTRRKCSSILFAFVIFPTAQLQQRSRFMEGYQPEMVFNLQVHNTSPVPLVGLRKSQHKFTYASPFSFDLLRLPPGSFFRLPPYLPTHFSP